MKYREKIIVIINLYRIPDELTKGFKIAFSQYNRVTCKELAAMTYKKKLSKEIKKYIVGIWDKK